jgi:hypothetical protein
VSFAISPSSAPAAASGSLSSPTAPGEGSGGFAALFDSVSSAMAPHRPAQPPLREPVQGSNNQAKPKPLTAPASDPQAEPTGESVDDSAPPESPAQPLAGATAATDAPNQVPADTPVGASGPPEATTALPADAAPLLAQAQGVAAAMQADAPAAGEPVVVPLVAPMALPGQAMAAQTAAAQPLRWQLLGGGMRVLTTPETPDPDSLAAFAQRQGLSPGQWQWLNGLAPAGRPPGAQPGPAGVSPGAAAVVPEMAALLPNAPGSGQVSTQVQAAGVVAGAMAPPVELLVLEVDPAVLAELGLGDEWRGEAAPRPGATATASLSASAAVASPAATYAAQWYRQGEAYQALARQLGEAMASRLQQQIGRGQWQLQLTLRPASLGRVDVDLAMRRGELEATFQTSQASTRELLVDSFPRLREALQQSGTQVASLDVQGESRGESDRKPTPQPLAAGEASSDESSQGAAGNTHPLATLDDDAVDVWA